MKMYFRGHDFSVLNKSQEKRLEKVLRQVLNDYQVDEFIFHYMHKIARQISKIVSMVLKDFPEVKTTFIKSGYDNLAKLKSDFSKKNGHDYIYVDEIKHFKTQKYYPKSEILLNYHIIGSCDICIFFFDHKIISKRAGVTAHAYDYALKKKKIVFNIAYKL